jgi:predicted double-glycine peptidase
MYFAQETNYTCGNACFRMVLNHLGLEDVPEETLIMQMKTTEHSGTHYDFLIDIADKYNLDCISKENSSLEEIDNLTKNGWCVIIGYTLDIPHAAVYLGNNGNHLFLNDPFLGEEQSHLIAKFVRAKWYFDTELYNEKDIKYKWFVAYNNKKS